jgi:predicted ArsR family transcriptional regulator
MVTTIATSDRILYQLKTKGPQTAGPMAAKLGITAMAVRQHLYRLKQQGLVDYRRAAAGRASDTGLAADFDFSGSFS